MFSHGIRHQWIHPHQALLLSHQKCSSAFAASTFWMARKFQTYKQNQNHRSSYSWCSLIYLRYIIVTYIFFYFLWRSLLILTWIIVKVCFLSLGRTELFFFVADSVVLSFVFNIVDNTAVFWILLNSTCTESPLSFFFPPFALSAIRLGVLKKLDEGRTKQRCISETGGILVYLWDVVGGSFCITFLCVRVHVHYGAFTPRAI